MAFDVDVEGLLAAKEVSMVASWAVRDMSIWACGFSFLPKLMAYLADYSRKCRTYGSWFPDPR